MNLDAEILRSLRAAGESSLPESDLARKLGITRPALASRIAALRELGFEIESSPHRGCRLIDSPDALFADDLVARLGKTKVIGRDIQVFEETTSTNDVVEKYARDGVAEGAVVFGESQTRGRGRLGRKWVSPARKGLWFSVLLRPKLGPREATQLSVASAVALRRAIQAETGLQPEIKWPNDLLVGGRKTAGILTELKAELDHISHVILGIGVDVNLNPSDFPQELRKTATSLKIELGSNVSRPALASSVLRELDNEYYRLADRRFAEVADEWESHCTTLGHRISIKAGDRNISGRAECLDEDGALLLRTDHGHLERVMGGDVTIEKANSATPQ
jgi:BirA family biotin operon repressor/biotin-[acetyl-CoA-carboxylase] ligase